MVLIFTMLFLNLTLPKMFSVTMFIIKMVKKNPCRVYQCVIFHFHNFFLISAPMGFGGWFFGFDFGFGSVCLDGWLFFYFHVASLRIGIKGSTFKVLGCLVLNTLKIFYSY